MNKLLIKQLILSMFISPFCSILLGQGGDTASRVLAGSNTLPSNCTIHSIYILDGTVGNNVYVCTSANTWTLQSGASATFKTNGTNNASQTTLNFLNGSAFNGLVPTFTYTGTGGIQLGFTGSLGGPGLSAPTASALGGIFSITSLTHNWVSYIDLTGLPHQSQPAAGDISGLGAMATGAYPSSGVAVSSGSAWSSSLAAPSSALVGISDTQTLTNKSINASEVNSGTLSTSQLPTIPRSLGGLNSTTPGTGFLRDATTPTAAELSGDAKTSGNYSVTVQGIQNIPTCTTFTPTNGQYFQYTTGSAPNPCWQPTTGTSGSPSGSASGDLTNSYPGPSVATFAGQINVLANNTANATCNGTALTDGTALNTLQALGVPLYLPPNKHCKLQNFNFNTSNVTFNCGVGAGFISYAATDSGYNAADYMYVISGQNVTFNNCTFDGNSTPRQAGSFPYTAGNVSSGVTGPATFNNVTFHNSGTSTNSCTGTINTTGYDCTGAIQGNQAAMTFINCTFDTTVLGYDLYWFPNGTTYPLIAIGNSFSGSVMGGIWGRGGNSVPAAASAAYIAGNTFTNIQDDTDNTGAQGNAIVLFNFIGPNIVVAGNNVNGSRYACVRLNGTYYATIVGNSCNGSGETTIYGEFGAAGNLIEGNTLTNGGSGITVTNISDRSPDVRNTVIGNKILNMNSSCIYVEHDLAEDNDLGGCPIGVIVGTSSSSHDNIVKNNHIDNFTGATYPTYTVVQVNGNVTGTNVVSGNDGYSANAVTLGQVVDNGHGLTLTAATVTGSSQVNFTFTGGSTVTAGQVWCGIAVSTPAAWANAINGQCFTILASPAPTGTTFSVTITNANTFGTFSGCPATAGCSPRAGMYQIYSSGTTPDTNFPSSILMTNQSIVYNQLSTMAVGTDVYVSDATCGSGWGAAPTAAGGNGYYVAINSGGKICH